MSIIVIKSNPKEWERVKNNVMEVEKAIFGKLAFEEEQFSTFKKAKAFNLLVYSNGRIIGYLMSQKLSSSGVHVNMKQKRKIFYLESVGLLSAYQGKGIGKLLFLKYIAQGKKCGCNSYLLDTKEKSMMGLAKHYGFKVISYNKKHFHNGKKWMGAYIMRKDLGER